MGDLKGRDVNGMHAAQWGKLDTSAISKVKVPDKCTNEQLTDAVKQMLVEAVNKLYGDSKDKKYVKIVDMIMMRVRGALAKLNEQIQEAQEENAKSLDIDELVSKLSKSLEKLIEENEKKRDEDTSKKLQELYDVVNDLVENEAKKSFEDSAKREETGQSKPEEQQSKSGSSNDSIDGFNKIDTSIKEQQDMSQSQLQLLEDLQKQITDSFSKIESLITANSVQKNAETAAVQMNKPVEEKITNIEKNNEKQIRQQISSLNERSGGLNDEKNEKEKGKDKKKEKKSKTDLKDVMTGKQFNMLKALLKTQFFEVVDITTEIIKKNNKQFKKINDNLEKLIKDRQKNGFSWTKLILFLSLFFIPFFWGNIKSLLKTAATSIDLDEKIDEAVKFVDAKVAEYTNNIDWDKHATALKDSIWDYLVKKFNEFIKDPMGWMAKEVEKTYNNCVAWVKDLWLVVTGQSKEKNEQEKKKIEDQHIKRIDNNISGFEKNLKDQTNEINGVAVIKTNELKQEVEKSNNFIVTSESETTKKLQQMQNVVEVKTQDLETTAMNSINSTSSLAASSQQNLEQGVNDAVSAGMKTLTNDTKSIIDTMNKNGPPSDFDKAMMKSFETASASVEKEEPNNLTQPDISKLASVKDYVMVKTDDKKGGVIARKSEVNDQLKLLEKNTKSKNVQHIQNYISFGQYDSTESAVKAYEDSETDDEKINRMSIIDAIKKKNKSKEKVNGEYTDETLIEREAKLYSSVNNAYDAVIKNSATIKDGLDKNQQLLDKIHTECNSIFTDISISLKTIKNSPSTPAINNTSIVSINAESPDANSVTDANMKD